MMRIHIVSNIDNGKGLERDYRLLAGLLQSWGHQVTGVHFQRADRGGQADLVIFLEVYEPRLAERAPRRWLIPNPEWWHSESPSALADFELVLCKTRDALARFAPLTARARYLGFFSEDHLDASVPRVRRFLHVPGGSDAKGTDSVLAAWERHRIPYPLTVVSWLRWGRRPPNVEIVGRIDERALRHHQNAARFHLCPSRYEGWGHVLHEGLSVGAAALVPDTEAMNEVDGCALRMPARPGETRGLARTFTVAPEDVHNAVERSMAFTEADLKRIQDAARDAFLTEREACFANLWELLGERPASSGRAPEPAARSGAAAAPRLAIVFPCHRSSAPLVRRSVLALRAQTADPSSFEVVVACDGGDPGGDVRSAVEPDTHPFRVTIVDSPRPKGDIAHRSHVRNAGWQAARAPLIWFLDSDFLLPPEAVAHVLHEHDAALARGKPAVFTPVLARVALTPPAWIDRSAAWAASGAPETFVSLLAATKIEGGIYSGYEDRYRPGAPSSETLADLLEGMPVVWRGLIDALGGFDEWFVGWGAEKEAFVDLLKGVQRAGLIDVRLLASVRAAHQPHETDPEARRPQVRQRQMERERRAREIVQGAPWWRERLSAARSRLASSVLDAAPADGTERPILDCSAAAVEARRRLVRAVRAVAAPALRGLYGGVVVAGEGAELIAQDVVRLCGLATRVVTVAELAALPASFACGAILSDVFTSAPADETERILSEARRVVKATGPLVVAEVRELAEVRVRIERAGGASVGSPSPR